MVDLDCKNCGIQFKLPKKPEPKHCGKPMILNKGEKQWECCNGPNCGRQDVLCDSCKE